MNALAHEKILTSNYAHFGQSNLHPKDSIHNTNALRQSIVVTKGWLGIEKITAYDST